MRLVTVVALYSSFFVPMLAAGSQGPTRGKPARVRYYISVLAELCTPDSVWVFGATNLPPGSIIVIYTYDRLGEGSKVLNDEADATVGTDGLFQADLRSKPGLQFRQNMVCDVSFGPDYPRQPPNVLKVLGRHGEKLGSFADNPEIGGNSRITTLATTTVIQ